MSATERLDEIEARITRAINHREPGLDLAAAAKLATEDAPALVAALRAVLEVHRPIKCSNDNCPVCADPSITTACRVCINDEDDTWPCPTVAALIDALEGKTT